MCLQGVGGWGLGEGWGPKFSNNYNFLFINFYTKIVHTKFKDNVISYTFPLIDVPSGCWWMGLRGEMGGPKFSSNYNFLFINFYTKISLTKLEDNLIFYSFPFIDVLSGVLFGRAPGRVGGTKFSNN